MQVCDFHISIVHLINFYSLMSSSSVTREHLLRRAYCWITRERSTFFLVNSVHVIDRLFVATFLSGHELYLTDILSLPLQLRSF